MKHICLCTAVFGVIFSQAVEAQLMATTSGPIPLEAVGSPPQVPALTLLGIASPGKLATDPSLPPKGQVSEVLYEELRGMASAAGPAGEAEVSVQTKFDEQGRITEQIEKKWNRVTDTLYRYQNGRLVSEESNALGGTKAIPHAWSYWTYDSQGLLTEYRRGSGYKIQNHELSFRYDNKRRLLGFEYRQGSDDRPFSRTELAYSSNGATVELTRAFVGTDMSDRSTFTLDNHGRVLHLVIQSKRRAADGEASDILFRYDERGRLVEQTTNASKFSDSGAEDDLPPGSILIAYDDGAHTKTTKYSFPGEGPLKSVATQDTNGATLAYDLMTGSDQVSTKLVCEYDRLGNWTSCVQTADNGEQKLVKERFRRTITYR